MPKSVISIRGLKIRLFLGLPKQERMKQQTISLDVDLWLPKTPKACLTDNIDHTVCYAGLIKHIQERIKAKKFYHLIEHLGHDIHTAIKKKVPAKTKIMVKITKKPKIENLEDSVSFQYWDGK